MGKNGRLGIEHRRWPVTKKGRDNDCQVVEDEEDAMEKIPSEGREKGKARDPTRKGGGGSLQSLTRSSTVLQIHFKPDWGKIFGL